MSDLVQSKIVLFLMDHQEIIPFMGKSIAENRKVPDKENKTACVSCSIGRTYKIGEWFYMICAVNIDDI